jgi:hypothetical protein
MPFKNGWTPQYDSEPIGASAPPTPFDNGWTPQYDTAPAASPAAASAPTPAAASAPASQTSALVPQTSALVPQGVMGFLGDVGAGVRQGITGTAASIAQLWGSPWAQREIAAEQQAGPSQSWGNFIGKSLAQAAPYVLTGAGVPALLERAGAGAASSLAESLLGQSALSGATAAAVMPGTPEERVKNAALAAGLTGATGAAVTGLGVGKRVLKAIQEPYTQSGQEAIVGRLINKAAGAPEQRAVAIQNMSTPFQGVRGYAPTAADVAQNPGISALQRYVAQAEPAEFGQALQQNRTAIADALRGLGGTAEQRAAAVEARRLAAKPLYESASQQSVPVDQEMQAILGTTAGNRAFNSALRMQSDKTLTPVETLRARTLGDQTNPGQMSGALLTDFQKALADTIKMRPQTAVQKSQQVGALGLKSHLDDWLQKNLPDLPAANQAFQAASLPLDRIDIGRKIYEKTVPAFGEGSVSPGLYGGRFADALRHADELARKTTGMNKSMEAILSPAQKQTIKDVGQSFEGMRNAAELGRGYGNSTTFQNLAMQNLAEQAGIPGWLSVLGRTASMVPLLGHGSHVLLGAGRALGEAVTNSQEQEMRALLARALLDPREAARLAAMQQAIPLAERPGVAPALTNLPGQLAGAIPSIFQ